MGSPFSPKSTISTVTGAALPSSSRTRSMAVTVRMIRFDA